MGSDSAENTYSSIHELWEAFPKEEWYRTAEEWYQDNCPETLDGVLGGFGSISPRDLEGSKQFLEDLSVIRPAFDVADGDVAELGAGIGRVSKCLLIPLGAKQCDLVESSARLVAAAPGYIGDEYANKCRFYCAKLQEWVPPPSTKYRIIWIQWVLCYLQDDDVVALLKRCADSLDEDGVIILKENVCDEHFVVDVEDASIARSLQYIMLLLRESGLSVVLKSQQDKFPAELELYPVPMLAVERLLPK